MENSTQFIVKFGKHEGKTLEQIAEMDEGYVVWFSKNYKQGTYWYKGKERESKPTEEDLILIEEAKRIAEIVEHCRKRERGAQMDKERKQGVNSEHQGEVGQRLELTVYFVREKKFADYSIYTFSDRDKNLFTWYNMDFNEDEEEGTLWKIKGTVKKHSEYNEVKTTHLNRVKMDAMIPYTSNRIVAQDLDKEEMDELNPKN